MLFDNYWTTVVPKCEIIKIATDNQPTEPYSNTVLAELSSQLFSSLEVYVPSIPSSHDTLTDSTSDAIAYSHIVAIALLLAKAPSNRHSRLQQAFNENERNDR
jgi:hypothetical protein